MFTGVSKIVKSQIESNSQHDTVNHVIDHWCVKDRQITNWKQFTTHWIKLTNTPKVCQRSSNHKLKAIHNFTTILGDCGIGVSKIVKSQIESNSQLLHVLCHWMIWCVKDRQITNWKQFTTVGAEGYKERKVCQRSSNHKLKAIHNWATGESEAPSGVSKIVKSQIESNSQRWPSIFSRGWWCVKDRQITNWKQFTTARKHINSSSPVCQRSSNHKLKAIHNRMLSILFALTGVSKIVKSQIESNSQHSVIAKRSSGGCVKDRQITNWKQFTTDHRGYDRRWRVCQRSSNHKLKAIHNISPNLRQTRQGVSKIVKSQIESNSQHPGYDPLTDRGCVKDRQITNWKQFTTWPIFLHQNILVCQRSSNHKLKAIHNRG